jgi:Domain of unknown function (DUF4389)
MGDNNPAVDQVAVDGNDKSEMEKHLKSRTTWLRLVFMIIFCVFVSLASMVGSVIVILGFLWVLFTGEVNRDLRQVGQNLATYIYQIIRYLTFNSEQKPFPFGEAWPSTDSDS